MTTISAIETDYYAVLCADSQITEDNLISTSSSTPKIVEVGKFLIGISGDIRPGDILTYNWKPPAYRGENPVTYMGAKVIPSMALVVVGSLLLATCIQSANLLWT